MFFYLFTVTFYQIDKYAGVILTIKDRVYLYVYVCVNFGVCVLASSHPHRCSMAIVCALLSVG